MTDRDALLAAICANPDEDTPRLALADYLDEHGAADDRLRARFIRVQIEMTRTEEQHPQWRKLYAAERKLLNDLTRRGALSTAHLEKRAVGSVGYERGFLAAIVVYAKRFLAEAERFYRDDPIQTVRFAKLSAKSGSVAPPVLFRSPHLAKLRALDLTNAGYGTDALGQIAASPHLAGLKRLVLARNPVTPEGVAGLIDSPDLPALQSLDLGFNRGAGDALATALASRPGLRRLRALSLSATGLTPAGVRALAASPHASGLEHLNVSAPAGPVQPGPRPGHEEIARILAGSPHLANLKELDLSDSRPGLDGLRAIAESPHLTRLRRLRLAYCNLPAQALKLAAGAANFRGLYLLELGAHTENDPRGGPGPDEIALREAVPDAAVRFW